MGEQTQEFRAKRKRVLKRRKKRELSKKTKRQQKMRG